MHLNKLHLLKNQTAYQHKHPNNCHAGWLKDVDLGLLCSHSIWAPYNHWVNHELLCMPEYCEVKFQTFCAVTKAWLKLCQVKMTNSKQWHKYTAEGVGKKKKDNQSGSAQSKFQSHKNWNADRNLRELWIKKCLQRRMNQPSIGVRDW